jgi:hypothetical protein
MGGGGGGGGGEYLGPGVLRGARKSRFLASNSMAIPSLIAIKKSVDFDVAISVRVKRDVGPAFTNLSRGPYMVGSRRPCY